MRSGNEMYCIIFICLMEVTGIKLQTFVMPMRTQGLHSALWAQGSTKMQQEDFLSYYIEEQKFLTVVGFFLVLTSCKKPTQNTFSLQNSHESENSLGQCWNSLISGFILDKQQKIFWNQNFSPGAEAIYGVISLSANFGCFVPINFWPVLGENTPMH